MAWLQMCRAECVTSLSSDVNKQPSARSASIALYTSSMWPTTEFDRLRNLAYFDFWLLVWDDEIGESEGSLTGNLSRSQAHRARTVEFVEQCLGLKNHDLATQDLHPFIASFAPFGQALRAAYTRGQQSIMCACFFALRT